MKDFLNKWRPGSSVNDFVQSMAREDWAPGSDPTELPPALAPFHSEPGFVAEQLFNFIATAPRELSEKVNELLEEAKGVMLTEEQNLELRALMLTTKQMGEQMDSFTKSLARGRAWASIYNAPVSVTRVWRTKRNEEIVGTPEERKLPLDQVPNRLSSIVLVEEESSKGVTRRPMLCVSDGHYRQDGAIGDVREDFLIDLPAMFAHSSGTGTFRGRRGCSQEHTQKIFTGIMRDAIPLIEYILAVAKPLVERGIVESDLYKYDQPLTLASKPLKAEENPDAKYEIGGWA